MAKSTQASAKSNKKPSFNFTQRTSLYTHSKPIKFTVFFLMFLYLAITIALALTLERPLIWLALIILFNFIVIVSLGRTIVGAIVFPYANSIIRNRLDAQLNQKFGEEFVKILDKSIRDVNSLLESKHTAVDYTSLVNSNILTAIELVSLYNQINTQVIEASKTEPEMHAGPQLIAVNNVFEQMITTLKDLRLFVKNPKTGLKEHSLWMLYTCQVNMSDFEALIHSNELPIIKDSKQNLALLDKLNELNKEFKDQVRASIAPCKCCCGRRTGCLLRFKKIFGTLEQMRFMLEKNFDGKHFFVKAQDDGTEIDCMFFPSTNEKVLIGDEFTSAPKKPSYIDLPTIMMCNPNALLYQHMVNSPNAFWLNFFLKKGVNVMAWNYRGYGHTKGSPSPYNIKTDGESIVYFMVETLKLKGQLGVYGRSLGGTVATHIGNKYQEKIKFLLCDRTFANFKSLSDRKFQGFATKALFNLLSFKWVTNNDSNFYNSKCMKIVTTDSQDDVIDMFSALNAGVASLAVQSHPEDGKLTVQDQTQFMASTHFLFKTEFFLFEQLQKMRSTKYKVKSNSARPAHNNDVIEIDLEERLKGDNKDRSKTTNIQDHMSAETIYKFENMKTEENDDSIQLVQEELHKLVLLLNDFQGGVVPLGEITNVNYPVMLGNSEGFLNCLEAYGSKYDTSEVIEPVVNVVKQRKRAIAEIDVFLSQLCLVQARFRQIQKQDRMVKQNIIDANLAQLAKIFTKVKSRLEQIAENGSSEKVGHLIQLKCGHRGRPNHAEEKLIENTLRDSGFIYNPNRMVQSVREENAEEQLEETIIRKPSASDVNKQGQGKSQRKTVSQDFRMTQNDEMMKRIMSEENEVMEESQKVDHAAKNPDVSLIKMANQEIQNRMTMQRNLSEFEEQEMNEDNQA